MKIVSRYILRHFLPVFILSLAAFMGLYLVIDFFEKVDDVLEKQAALPTVALYFLYKSPYILTQGIPMATLLATLLALGILARNRELIALKASGVKPLAFTAPIIFAALALSFMDFGIGEFIARSMNQKAQRMWDEKVLHRKTAVQWSKKNVWYRGRDLIYQIRLYDRRNEVLEKASLYFVDGDFRLVRRLDAKRLRWQGDHWLAEEGIVLRFEASGTEQEPFKERRIRLKETPEDFSTIETIPAELNWLDLYHYARQVNREGYDSAPYWVELHLRAAFPLTALILALLGICISLRQGSQGGIALGVGVALVVAFAYITLLQLGCSLATAGILPPLLGVWAANVIFAVGSIYAWMIAPQ